MTLIQRLNNSKVRFAKEAGFRVDKPDFADRAVTEAIVNSLIHRDYIVLGSEVHIDIYDDRLEIQSPGGMFEGRPIQECDINVIGSARRNPVIADLFHRMKYMERRGSGLKKILSETAKLPGYTEQMKPEFHSTPTDFRVVLKNINYKTGANPQVNPQVELQVELENKILLFCLEAKSKKEIAQHCGYKDIRNFSSRYLQPLIDNGQLQMTIPDKPNSRLQKYATSQIK